jgi:hypothetical protein
MMLYQFRLFDETEQAEAVWNDGMLLDERSELEHRILLNQIDSFYVEMYYHKEYKEYKGIRSFQSVEQLNPYLDKIDFKDLNQ